MTSDIFTRFKDVSVLIIGDVMIDRYLSGKVSRISPEAPVPVVLIDESDNRLGGAANVALNVKALGAKPFLCSLTGDDEEGRLFLDLLAKEGISNAGISQSKSRPTTLKTRILSMNQHMLRCDRESTEDLTPQENEILIELAKKLIKKEKIKVVIFQDYNKGVLTQKLIADLLEYCKKEDIATVVDPKYRHFFDYKGVSLFKPNLKEVSTNLGISLSGDDDAALAKACLQLRSRLQAPQNIWITLSEHGIYIDNGNSAKRIPTFARKIADVCGAGDTVVSVAAVGLAAGMSSFDLGRLANLAGGQVCGKAGVVALDKEALIKAFSKT